MHSNTSTTSAKTGAKLSGSVMYNRRRRRKEFKVIRYQCHSVCSLVICITRWKKPFLIRRLLDAVYLWSLGEWQSCAYEMWISLSECFWHHYTRRCLCLRCFGLLFVCFPMIFYEVKLTFFCCWLFFGYMQTSFVCHATECLIKKPINQSVIVFSIMNSLNTVEI